MNDLPLCACGCGERVSNRRNRYVRQHHHKVPPPERNPETGCLEWRGYIDPSTGYGQGYDPRTGKKGNMHRVEWEKVHGPVAKGVHVHHECGVRHCIEVGHMRLMTKRAHGQIAKAKLDLKRVREIRKRSHEGERASDLAREYGVHRQTIADIKAGRSWNDHIVCPKCGHEYDPYPTH